jgi:3-oxoacyl-[acyl-carrier protein] reductase
LTKTVLITGASGGIGRSLVRSFAGAGYNVGVNYFRNKEGAEAALRDARGAGVEAGIYQADSADSGAVRAMVTQSASELGEITHLVCNAGFSQQKLFTEISDREWERMFAVHVHGAFFACQAVIPAMIRRKEGAIVTVSSMWGQTGASCEVHYSAAKAALEGMTKALAKELGPSGIRVNGIAPGAIDTVMNREVGEDALKALAEDTALGRLGLPEEVAALAVFLCDDKAAYITGQIIGCNGGFLM